MTVSTQSTAARRLIAVAEMPDSTPEDRGRKVLAAASAVRNVSADMISDHVRDLLSTAVWQDYCLPNGRRYRWRTQEFDYFLSAAGLDPTLVDHIIRGSGDRSLLVALAEATSDRKSADRRTVEEVADTYPELATRLHEHPMAGAGIRKLIGRASAQARYLAGEGAEAASSSRRGSWRVEWRGERGQEAIAQTIAEKLLANPQLAEAVRRHLG